MGKISASWRDLGGVMQNKTEDSKTCTGVMISARAYTSILAEALSRDPLETGGILLGHYKSGIWYIVEATDPGVETFHSEIHSVMDEKYHNHLYPVLSRIYREDLYLMGLWHRHPGSLDTLSFDDHETNRKYAEVIGNGTLSILLNLDPEPRLTCYYLDFNKTGKYYRPPIYIGDRKFRGTGYLNLASPDELFRRQAQMKVEISCNP